MKKMILRKMAVTSIVSAATMGIMTLGACSWGVDDEYVADKVAAEQHKASASPSMESAIDGVLSGDNLDLSNFDASEFQQASRDYSAAIEADRNDAEALFGRALTSVVAVMGDPSVKDAMDEVTGSNNPMMASGDQSTAIRLAKIATSSDDAFPQISKIQDDVAGPFFNALDQAILDLDQVTRSDNFEMNVTIDGESRLVGLSEAYTLLAGYRVMRAQMTLAMSRNVDIDQEGSYDFIDHLSDDELGENLSNQTLSKSQEDALNHLVDLMSVGSPFLTIREGWQDRVDQIVPEVRQAALDMKSAITEVKDDSDYLLNGQDMSLSDRDNMQEAIDSLLRYLDEPFQIELNHGAQVEVFLPALLSVRDPKALFPYYEFYEPNEWSEEKPIIFFTDGNEKTGSLQDIQDIDNMNIRNSQKISRLKSIIYFQDPTFAGALPEMTRSRLWKLIEDEEKFNEF